MVDSRPSPTSRPNPGGRPRHEHVDAKILQATLGELVEHGVSRVSIQGVARRAGLARGMVSLRWSTVESLVIAALETTGFGIKSAVGLPIDVALEVLISSWSAVLRDPLIRRVLLRLAAERDLYPSIWSSYETTIARPVYEEFEQVILAARVRGEIRPDVQPEMIRSIVLSTLWAYEGDDPEAHDLALHTFVLRGMQ